MNKRNDLYPREKYLAQIRGFYHQCEIIKVISGVRRSGKSSIMHLVMDELLKQGIDEKNIIYLDLDSEPYLTLTSKEKLNDLLKEYKQIEGVKYLFIDEIQNINGFEIIINAYRLRGDFSIFITGSNSYLLSGELVTKLTGRYVQFEVLPFTFDEYIKAKQYFGMSIAENLKELNQYIVEGGFPFLLKLPIFKDKRKYVIDLLEEIFKKDIKRRIKIRNRSLFEAVAKYIINNFGALISIQNIVDEFRNNDIIIKRETVKRYIDILVSAKIILECDIFDMKSRKSLMGHKKYYLSDLSFYFALNTDNQINYGPVLENIVYTYALSKGYQISVGKIGQLECDFLLRDDYLSYSYVQVAYTILSSKQTEDREYRSLEQIKDNYPKYVLTTDVLIQKRNGIKHENLMDFMINDKNF